MGVIADYRRTVSRPHSLLGGAGLAPAAWVYAPPQMDRPGIDPELALLERGLALHHAGDFPAAIAEFTAAIVVMAEPAYGHQLRGNARRKAGDKEGALQDYDLAIALDPALKRPPEGQISRGFAEVPIRATPRRRWHATFRLARGALPGSLQSITPPQPIHEACRSVNFRLPPLHR